MENYTPESITEEAENTTAEAETSATAAPISAPMPVPGDPVVGTGTFFGLEFLFALPLVGFLCCIIFSFAPKNRNLKHYARGKLIWTAIGLVLSLILVLVTVIFLQALPGMVSQELGVPVEDIEDIISIAEDIPGLVEEFGGIEEIAGLVGSIGELGDISEIVDSVGDIANVVGQISEIENIEEIVSQLGDIEDVDALVSELEKMDNIDEIITQIENIDNIEELAEQIDNPEVVDALLDAYKNYKG